MDPITAVSNCVAKGLDLAIKIVEKQPPEVAAELWKMYLADVKEWREFWGKLGIGAKP